jgi:L-cysteine S-thiosulfotransferase
VNTLRWAATLMCAGLGLGLGPGLGPGLGQMAQAATDPPLRSGFEDMSATTQALQQDDTLNPGWFTLLAGQDRFQRDCTTCHSLSSLRGAAVRYPAYDRATGRPITLAGRINQCRALRSKQGPYAAESEALLGLETVVAHASRGLPVQPPADARLAPWRAQGQALFHQPMGQLALSCAQCHDQHAGGRLAGSTIPQGHPNGYPLYRLEWQAVGSLQRRLRNCMTGVRAQPFEFGSAEFTALELHLMQRAAGLPLETPAVRP